MTRGLLGGILSIVLALAATACAASRAPRPEPAPAGRHAPDAAALPFDPDLAAKLNRIARESGVRAITSSDSGFVWRHSYGKGRPALVIVDGTVWATPDRPSTVNFCEALCRRREQIEDLQILPREEAVRRFGNDGRNGAVLIRTRDGAGLTGVGGDCGGSARS